MTTTTITANTTNLNEFWSVPNPNEITVSFFILEARAIAQAKLWGAKNLAYFPVGSTNKSDWGNWIESAELVKWGNLATQRTQATLTPSPLPTPTPTLKHRPQASSIRGMGISDANAAYNEEIELNNAEYLEFCVMDMLNNPRI